MTSVPTEHQLPCIARMFGQNLSESLPDAGEDQSVHSEESMTSEEDGDDHSATEANRQNGLSVYFSEYDIR